LDPWWERLSGDLHPENCLIGRGKNILKEWIGGKKTAASQMACDYENSDWLWPGRRISGKEWKTAAKEETG